MPTPKVEKPETQPPAAQPAAQPEAKQDGEDAPVEEIGGPKGPDPTRFGDWSVNGRCFDF